MDLFVCCCWNLRVCVPFRTEDSVSHRGNQQAHQRTDKVEEAVGEVGESGYSEHSCLSHTATAPGEEHRSDAGGVFHAAAEQSGLIAAFLVNILEQIGSQYDGKVLVGYYAVQRSA